MSEAVPDQSGFAREWVTVPELAELFEVTPGRVRRLLEERILAGKRIDGVLRIPADFLLDGEPLPQLRGTLIVLHDAGFSDDEAVDWLLNPQDSLSEVPVDALRSGRKTEVRRAAQALAF